MAFYYDTILVSLKEREDRRADTFKEFANAGVPPVFSVWNAVKDPDGRRGLIATMQEIFEARLREPHDTPLLILEDDIKIVQPGYSKKLERVLAQLPADFKLLYLGCNLAGEFTRYSDNLLLAKDMYSSHAILYSRAAIEAILPGLKNATAYDRALATGIQKTGGCYCAFPMLMSQRDGYSDIEKREVRYQRFLENRFAQKTAALTGIPVQEPPQSAS